MLAKSILLGLFLLATLPLSAQRPAPNLNSRLYVDWPVYQLARAQQQQNVGNFESALQFYDEALAMQPGWIPALAGRAEMLYRLGRRAEADRSHHQAFRTNPTATAFYLARRNKGLLSFLALYPSDWYARRYRFASAPGPFLDDAFALEDFFVRQTEEITAAAADSSVAVRALLTKMNYNVAETERLLESLPRDYNPAVREMLGANLAMLRYRFQDAVEGYGRGMNAADGRYPELRYNRGLAYILLYNYDAGCADLRSAANDGYSPARVMYNRLCEN